MRVDHHSQYDEWDQQHQAEKARELGLDAYFTIRQTNVGRISPPFSVREIGLPIRHFYAPKGHERDRPFGSKIAKDLNKPLENKLGQWLDDAFNHGTPDLYLPRKSLII